MVRLASLMSRVCVYLPVHSTCPFITSPFFVCVISRISSSCDDAHLIVAWSENWMCVWVFFFFCALMFTSVFFFSLPFSIRCDKVAFCACNGCVICVRTHVYGVNVYYWTVKYCWSRVILRVRSWAAQCAIVNLFQFDVDEVLVRSSRQVRACIYRLLYMRRYRRYSKETFYCGLGASDWNAARLCAMM